MLNLLIQHLNDQVRARHPLAHQVGEAMGTWLADKRQQKSAERNHNAALSQFRLKGQTEEERYTELLAIAHERGLLKRKQDDPRTQAIGFKPVEAEQ